MRVVSVVNGPWRQNCYLAIGRQGAAVIVDPGSDAETILRTVAEYEAMPVGIVNTHGHFDHVGAVAVLSEHFDIPFFLHNLDHRLLRQANLYLAVFGAKTPIRIPKNPVDLADHPEGLDLGEITVDWFETPGHTAGSVCLKIEDVIFTGDTILASGRGRTDLPGGDTAAMDGTIHTLKFVQQDLMIYPGHGRPCLLATALSAAAERNEPVSSSR